MENKKIAKEYFKKYFKSYYMQEDDDEFKSLVRILNKKDKQVKNLTLADVGNRRELLIAFMEHLNGRNRQMYYVTPFVIDEFLKSNL